MRGVLSIASRGQVRFFAASKSSGTTADPWSAAPHQEAALRDAIMKATPQGSSSPGGQLAKALFAATEIANQAQKGKVNLHDQVNKDLKAIGEALAMPDWVAFFKSPVISKEARSETLNELFTKMGASEITRQFFARLIEGKQTKFVPEMLGAYQNIQRSKRGEIEATVVTAKALSPKEVQRLRQLIIDEFLGGATTANVILTQTVDSSLLGGLTLTVGSTYIDLSIKSQIDDIAQEYSTIITASRENALQRRV